MIHRFLLTSQGGEGGGTPPTPPADPSEAFRTLLAMHNQDGVKLAEKLFGENHDLRRKNATLRAGVPEEGSVILKGDDVKDWQKYRELGKPGDVRKSLDEGQSATRKLEGIDRVVVFRKAARLADLEPDVFADLAEAKGLKVEVVEETRDDKVVEVAFVRGEGDSRTPLKKFVESQLSSYLPALMQGKQPPKERDRSRDTTPPRAGVSPFAHRPEEGAEERGLVGRVAYAT